MITVKNQLVQLTSAAIIFVMIFGVLMIWPGIMALFLGVFLLLQSCGAEQETATVSWTEAGNVPAIFAS